MFLKKCCFFFLSILVSSLSFAQQVNFEDSFEFKKIIENHNSCIKCIDENKLYLQEKNICPTQDGLFLVVNEAGDYVHLPSLLSDANGCYIHFSRTGLAGEKNIEVRNKCPSCGERYIVKCANKDCPSNKKDKEKGKGKQSKTVLSLFSKEEHQIFLSKS